MAYNEVGKHELALADFTKVKADDEKAASIRQQRWSDLQKQSREK